MRMAAPAKQLSTTVSRKLDAVGRLKAEQKRSSVASDMIQKRKAEVTQAASLDPLVFGAIGTSIPSGAA